MMQFARDAMALVSVTGFVATVSVFAHLIS